MTRRLLMISTDRLIFSKGSAVRARQAEYATQWDEVHVIIFAKRGAVDAVAAETPITTATPSEDAIAPNCWAYSTRSRARWRYVLDAIRLGRFIIAKRGITEMTCQDPFFTALVATTLKKNFPVPLEIQVHTDIGSPYFARSIGNRLRAILARSYVPKADAIRVVSERIKTYLVERLGIDAAKVTVRPIAVDVERIKAAPVIVDLHWKYRQFAKIALIAARLEPEKDIAMAIYAWQQIVASVPKAGLIIIGSGSQGAALKALVGRLGLTESVVFEPWADAATLFSYYKTADVFLMTSFYEGYGMTLVEAAAAGCKVISTDVGVARETGATIIAHTAGALSAAVIYTLR